MTGFSQSIPEKKLYLGQTPPGNSPEIFSLDVNPGFFAAERIAISNDGGAIYYSQIEGYYPNRGESIRKYTCSAGIWTGPVILFEGFAAPALSITGDTMYTERNFETFFSVRKGSDWSKPKRILIRSDSAHYYQVTGSRNFYLSSKPKKGAGLSDWCKVIVNDNDTTVLSLGKPLNNAGENLDFFISKDESYMIVTNRPGLGISYRNRDGSWTTPIDLGAKIDFGLGSWGPWVTNDHKYLFYSTGTKTDYSDVHIYWVRIDCIIDSLKRLSTASSKGL